jgi:hypothetical protein
VGNKGARSPECHGPAGDRTVTLARPFEAPFPSLGKTCWVAWAGGSLGTSGRSNPADRGRSLAVKGIPVRGKRAPFAGRSWNAGLGRSTSPAGVSSLVGASTDDKVDVLRTPRRGTSSLATSQGARAEREGNRKNATHVSEDTSFTRSSDPCASIVTTHRRRKSFGGGAAFAVSQSGKPAQAGGTGCGVADAGRSAARRAQPIPQGIPKGKAPARKNRKEIMVSVPARNESRLVRARTSKQVVAEVGRRHRVSNKLGKRAPKRAVRVG